jgi:hypothetical protein
MMRASIDGRSPIIHEVIEEERKSSGNNKPG